MKLAGGRGTRAGVGLADAVVACAVLASFLVIVLLVHQVGRQGLTNGDVRTDPFRNAANLVERIRHEMRASRVREIRDEGATLVFHPARRGQVLPGGLLLFTAAPSLIQQGPGGEVVLVEGASGRRLRLAQLGHGGTLRFSRPSRDLLHMAVRAEAPERPTEHAAETEADVYLPNQL